MYFYEQCIFRWYLAENVYIKLWFTSLVRWCNTPFLKQTINGPVLVTATIQFVFDQDDSVLSILAYVFPELI